VTAAAAARPAPAAYNACCQPSICFSSISSLALAAGPLCLRLLLVKGHARRRWKNKPPGVPFTLAVVVCPPSAATLLFDSTNRQQRQSA
jgi:hypothetical protein